MSDPPRVLRPLRRVTAPDMLWPTLVTKADGCLLSALHGVGEPTLLPPHPSVLVGRAFHDAMERMLQNGMSDPANAAPSLDAAFAAIDLELADDRRFEGFIPLQDRVPFDKVEHLLRRLGRVAARDRRRKTARQEHGSRCLARDHGPLSPLPEGTEVGFSVPGLDLKGRIDWIVRDDDCTNVTDLKTGSARIHGQVRSQYALQLHLYALALEWHGEKRAIRLWIDDGDIHEVPWTPEARRGALAALRTVRAALPRDRGWLSAMELAKPGPDCTWCRVRHVCPGYIAASPGWRRAKTADHRVPHDAWGTVRAVGPTDDGDLVGLEDASGRKLTIAVASHAGRLVVGQTGWFFDLVPEADVRGGRTATAYRFAQPSDFHPPTSVYLGRAA